MPYAWRLENLFVVNAGTVSTTRLRGKTKPCYNVIEASPERVRVLRKYPFHEQDAILSFDPRTYEYEKDSVAARRDGARLSEARVADGPVIALIDGEHHPAAVRELLDRLEAAGSRAWSSAAARRSSAPARSSEHYGRPVETDPEAACGGWRPARTPWSTSPTSPCCRRRQAAARRARALTWACATRRPALRLDPPRYEPVPFDAAEAGRDRHRQAHGQDGRGGPLGRRSCARQGEAR